MNVTADIRKQNTLKVLKTVIQTGITTKVNIAAQTGMTLMTVNTIINKLVEMNVLIECGNAESDTGRKAMLYAVNEQDFCILGINIGIGTVAFAISNLLIEKKDIKKIEFSIKSKPDEVIGVIIRTLNDIMKQNDIKLENIIGLGVTVPGPVNSETGIIHSLPNLNGWEGISLKTIFKEALGVPVFVEKDNYASVLYTKSLLEIPYDNVVSLTIRGGIGTGILLGEKIYRGNSGIAGEIGHITIDNNGPRCNCGNYGCLECYASDFSIINEVKEKKGNEKGRKEIIGNEPSIDDIIAAAKDGDELCCCIIMKAAEYLGLAVSNAIKMFDPACFIINSKWIDEVKGTSDVITDMVNKKGSFIQHKNVLLIFHYEEDSYLMGALSLVVSHLLEKTTENRLVS